MTPTTVHSGEAAHLFTERQQTLAAAYAAHPERFVKGPPNPPTLPTAVWINPPKLAVKPAAAVGAVDPVDNSEHSGKLSTSPQPAVQKGAASRDPDRAIRL